MTINLHCSCGEGWVGPVPDRHVEYVLAEFKKKHSGPGHVSGSYTGKYKPPNPMPKKQEEFDTMTGPGIAPPRFKDIDRAADSLAELLEERASLSENITAAEKKVLDKLAEHGLTGYKYRDQEVTINPGKTHVRIKTVKAEGVDGADAAANAADAEAEGH